MTDKLSVSLGELACFMTDSSNRPPYDRSAKSRDASTRASLTASSNSTESLSFKIKPVNRKRRPPQTVVNYTPEILTPEGKERRVRIKADFAVVSTVSMKVLNESSRCRGYPTLFRPEVGAVGGSISERPKANPIALLLVAAVTLIVANSSPMDRLVQILQSERATAQASTWKPEHEKPQLFNPLFGPTAVEECAQRCDTASSSEQTCQTKCQQLSLVEYAKPTERVLEAASDANAIVESCLANSIEKKRAENLKSWQVEASKSLTALSKMAEQKAFGDFAVARLQVRELNAIMANLRFPPNEANQKKQEALTERTLRASCLKTHLSLAELGRILAHQNVDERSEKYYNTVHHRLREPLAKVLTELKKDEKALTKLPKNS